MTPQQQPPQPAGASIPCTLVRMATASAIDVSDGMTTTLPEGGSSKSDSGYLLRNAFALVCVSVLALAVVVDPAPATSDVLRSSVAIVALRAGSTVMLWRWGWVRWDVPEWRGLAAAHGHVDTWRPHSTPGAHQRDR